MGWSAIDKAAIENETRPYHARRHIILFGTLLSGAAGGALWGAVSGTLAGFGAIHLPTPGLEHVPLAIQGMAWAETAVGAILAGGIVGGLLGLSSAGASRETTGISTIGAGYAGRYS